MGRGGGGVGAEGGDRSVGEDDNDNGRDETEKQCALSIARRGLVKPAVDVPKEKELSCRPGGLWCWWWRH